MVEAPAVVVVRAYDDDDARDRAGVEEVERACEVGGMSGGGKMWCASSRTSSATRSAAFATRRTPSCWYVYTTTYVLLSLSVCSVYTPTLWSCLAGGCGPAAAKHSKQAP